MRYTYLYLKFLLSILWLCSSCQPPSPFEVFIKQNNTSFDLLIKNGSIVDGTGAEPYIADVLIRDSKIVFIGKVEEEKLKVQRSIDATDKVVTPGFIDMHAHGDPFSNNFENFIAMGVTSSILGQDGYNTYFKDSTNQYEAIFNHIASNPTPVNVGFLVGHNSIRMAADAYTEGLSDKQLQLMLDNLSDGLSAGCLGMSTGLEYLPGIYSEQDELEALAKVVGEYNGIIMSHMRNEDDDMIRNSIDELLAQGQFCKVHISHLKIVYGKGEERGKKLLKYLEDARNQGRKVSVDAYPYTAGYTGISIVFPKWAKSLEQFEIAKKTRKKELEDYLLKRVKKRNGPEAVLFGSEPYAGMTLAEVAEQNNETYVQTLMRIGPSGGSGAFFVMDKAVQNVFVADKNVMISTDGSPGMRHPRSYGTYAKLIEDYVEDYKQIPLQDAIFKITGLPAATLELRDRGIIKVGVKADLNIFKPEEVKNNATFVNPFQLASGFDVVIINGQIARENGVMSEKFFGEAIFREF